MYCSPLFSAVNQVRTVSDAKRDFYQHHTRPINSIYRRVVDELLVEMHLLSVNQDFEYDAIYALGVVTTFDRFMQSYQPEADRDSIFIALCKAVGSNPDTYRQDADWVKSAVQGMDLETLKGQFHNLDEARGQEGLRGLLSHISDRPRFKYSRPFGIGLYTLLETVDSEAVQNTETLNSHLAPICEALQIPPEKLQKDLDLYRSNLEKLAQAQEVMQDILAAERKKREQRENAETAQPDAAETPETAETVTTPVDEGEPNSSTAADN